MAIAERTTPGSETALAESDTHLALATAPNSFVGIEKPTEGGALGIGRRVHIRFNRGHAFISHPQSRPLTFGFLATSTVQHFPSRCATANALLNASRLIRLISARFDAVVRRVTQDPEGLFCPMKVGTARDFVTTDYQPPELRLNEASRALSGKTTRTKTRNESLSTGR